jgi:hypothetical protein
MMVLLPSFPNPFSPQHHNVPVVLTAQVWLTPEETAAQLAAAELSRVGLS